MSFSRGLSRAGIAARRVALSGTVAAILCAAGCTLSTTTNETSRREPPVVARAATPIDVDRRVTTPPVPEGISQWDFGKAGRWGDFAAFPGSSDVTISRRAHFGHEREGNFPDALTGDFLEGAKYDVTVTGLKKGSYRGALIAANVVRGMVPGRDFSVRANGITVVDVEVTPQWFFSKEGFFYGVGFDDLPGTDWWERYIRPYTRWRHFEFESNGRLELGLEHCRLYALVVAPKPAVDQETFNTYIRATQAARKAHFLFNRLILIDQGRRRRSRPTQAERERAYVIFSRPWWRDVTFHSVPSPNEKTDVLKVSGAPGERVPVTFSVRALRRLVSVEVAAGELISSDGGRIPSEALDVRAVRYKLSEYEDGFRIVPKLLQKQPGLSLPARLTKRWWLTLNVPEGTRAGIYKGKITFKPSNAAHSTIDLHLRVYPFELAKPECSIGVWYDDPRLSGYSTGLVGGVSARGTSEVAYKWPDRPSKADRQAEDFRLRMLEADMASLAEHGFNGMTVPVPRVLGFDIDSNAQVDFRALEAYPRLLKKYNINTAHPGQTDVSGLALQLAPGKDPAGNATIVNEDGNSTVNFHFNISEPFETSAMFSYSYLDALDQMRRWWNGKGISLFALAIDQPTEVIRTSHNRNLKTTLLFLDIIRKVGGIKSTVTTQRDVIKEVDYMPVLEAEDLVQARPWSHNKRSVEYAQEAGKPLRFFNGAGFRRYDFGFYLWSRRVEGYWQQHFVFRGRSFNPFWGRDSGHAVYASPEGPLPTIRYERAAQGILDYRYALTLEHHITRARASNDRRKLEAADRAARLLGQIRRGCTRWALGKNGKPVKMDPAKLQRWRTKVAQAIIAIQTPEKDK